MADTMTSGNLRRTQTGVTISLSEYHAAMLADVLYMGIGASLARGETVTQEALDFVGTLVLTLANEWPVVREKREAPLFLEGKPGHE